MSITITIDHVFYTVMKTDVHLTLTKARTWDSWTSVGQRVGRRECTFLAWLSRPAWRSSVTLLWINCKIASETENEEYLPFACLYIVLIPGSFLHMGEPELSHGSLIAIRSTKGDVHAKVQEAGPGFGTPVICCSIQDEYDVVSPTSTELRS